MVMNEIKGYIMSIFCTIILLIVGSVCWYRLHLNYQNAQEFLNSLQEVYVNEEVVLSDIQRISDQKAIDLKSYRLVLNNDSEDTKKVSIKLVDDYYNQYNSVNKIENNYLRYMIKKNDGSYSDIRSLNLDGELYIDNLESNSENVYEIKIWVSSNYKDTFDYHGNLIVVYL